MNASGRSRKRILMLLLLGSVCVLGFIFSLASGSLKLSIPEILLLDEPTIFLDICYQFEVLELVRELNRSLGIATVMVLHDLNQAARYAHTIAALSEGMIVETGSPSAIITQALLERIFRIRVDVRNDAIQACPYFIPIESLHNRITDERQAHHGRRE